MTTVARYGPTPAPHRQADLTPLPESATRALLAAGPAKAPLLVSAASGAPIPRLARQRASPAGA